MIWLDELISFSFLLPSESMKTSFQQLLVFGSWWVWRPKSFVLWLSHIDACLLSDSISYPEDIFRLFHGSPFYGALLIFYINCRHIFHFLLFFTSSLWLPGHLVALENQRHLTWFRFRWVFTPVFTETRSCPDQPAQCESFSVGGKKSSQSVENGSFFGRGDYKRTCICL